MIRKYKATSPTKPVVSAESDTPPDEFEELKKRLLKMEVNEITAYALENNIDIGNATSQSGIYKKIIAHLEAAKTE